MNWKRLPTAGAVAFMLAACGNAAVTAIPGMLLAGGMDGVLRIHDGATGGAAGAAVSGGRIFVNSGYGIYGHMPGNVLLVFGKE